MVLKPPTPQLQPDQFQQVPRMIAGSPLTTFIVNGQPYILTADGAAVLNCAESTLLGHLATVYQKESSNARGSVQPTPLQSYQIPVYFQSTSDTGRGGGTQWKTIHSLKAFLMAARRSRNADRQTAVLNEVDAVYLEYQASGFVVDPYAAQHDPLVIPKMVASTVAHNYSPARSELASISHSMDWVFKQCTDAYYPDGSVNEAGLPHFRRCVYNTGYVASTGLTSLELKFTRFNPEHITGGLVNYISQGLPGVNCVKTASNLMEDFEIFLNNGLVNMGFSAALKYKFDHGAVSSHEALQIIYHRLATLSDHMETPDIPWQECPESAISRIVNMPDKSYMKADVRVRVDRYWELRKTIWSNLTQLEIQELRAIHQALVYEAVYGEEHLPTSAAFDI